MILEFSPIDCCGDRFFGSVLLVCWVRRLAESFVLSLTRRSRHHRLRVHRRSFRWPA
jgi:hypothetical protein